MKFFKFLKSVLCYNNEKRKELKMVAPNLTLGKLKSYSVFIDGVKSPLTAMMVSDQSVQNCIETLEMNGTYAVVRWDGDTDKFYMMSILNKKAELAAREFYGFAKGYINAKDLNVEWSGKDMSYTVKLPSEVSNGIVVSCEQALCFAFIMQESI